jgi:hypothetical protein
VELQVRKEADGAGNYGGDRGGTLRTGKSGDAGPDGSLSIESVSWNVGEIGRVRSGPAFHITYGIVICYFGGIFETPKSCEMQPIYAITQGN